MPPIPKSELDDEALDANRGNMLLEEKRAMLISPLFLFAMVPAFYTIQNVAPEELLGSCYVS